MFAIFIIFAWSLTLAASVGLLVYGAVVLVTVVTASSPIAFLESLIETLSKSLFSPVYGENSVAAYPVDETTNSGYKTTFMIWAVVTLVLAITLAVIAIIELVRLKKNQKLSKPFIKVTMITSAVVILLTGQLLLVLVAVLLFAALVLLETVLFDAEALNNYAEERNLISIYREERKFEKEVTKEGKLHGNVDLKNLQREFQKENDQTKTNDNSALPILTETQLEEFYSESKNKKHYKKWKAWKADLVKKREELEGKLSSLDEKKKTKLITKFNAEIFKLNEFAKKINIPESYFESFMSIENEVEMSAHENFNIDKFMKDSGITTEELKLYDEELQKQIEDLNKEELKSYDTFANARSFSDNLIEKDFSELNDIDFEDEPEEVELEKVSVQDKTQVEETPKVEEVIETTLTENDKVDMSLDDLKLSDIEADSTKENIYEDFKFEQKDFVNEIAALPLKENEIESLEAIKEEPKISQPPLPIVEEEESVIETNEKETKVIDKDEDNMKNLEFLNVIPEKPSQEKGLGFIERDFVAQKLSRAVNMDLNQLTEAENSDKESIYSDFNFEQKDLTSQLLGLPENKKTMDESLKSSQVIQNEQLQSSEENKKKSEITKEFTATSENTESSKAVSEKGNIPLDDAKILVEDKKNEEVKISREQFEKNLFNDVFEKAENANREKFTSIETRMLRLENLIENLGAKLGDNWINRDYLKIIQQLESISNVVKDLESSSPRAIIDSLTTRHSYNKNNG